MREVAIMRRISHPHLVHLYEVLGNTETQKMYLMIQYVNKGKIVKELTDKTIVSIKENALRKRTRQIVSALKYLHVHRVIHRDIKPENISVVDKGTAFLSDIGVSEILSEGGITGVEGNSAFMPPELCRNDLIVTAHLVDIWALGIPLFQLMYGCLPFIASTPYILNKFIINRPLEFPDEVVEGSTIVPSPEFKETVREMLQKGPAFCWGVRKILEYDWLVPKEIICVNTIDDGDSFVDMEVTLVDMMSSITYATVAYS